MLDRADWWTAAELYGIEDDALVDGAVRHLRLEPLDQSAFGSFALHYQPSAARPIIIDRAVLQTVEVRSLLQEDLYAGLLDATGAGAERVREHLGRVLDVVSLELGVRQLEDMGMVIAYEIARWIARMGDGYIRDVDDIWWEIVDWSWRRVFPETLPQQDGRV